MSICLAKKKNTSIPSQKCIENCLRTNKKMNIAINKDGLNYIIRDVSSYKTLMHIYADFNFCEDDAMIIKFFDSYATFDKKQPLIVMKDYNEMVKDISEKSVIIFHKSPSGINNIPKEITPEMFFSQMLCDYDFVKNSELFSLAIGDNKAAIMNPNGEIHLLGVSKTKPWECNEDVFYSDNDYKYPAYYNGSSYYNGIYEEDEYASWTKNQNTVCVRCKKQAKSYIYLKNQPYCTECYNLNLN